MNDINQFGAIVKILENPKETIISNKTTVVKCRGQLAQIRNTWIVTLVFWGNLAREVNNYYKINDYILIEGYLSFRDKKEEDLNKSTPKSVEVSVLKVYPFLLSSDQSINKFS